MKKVWVVFLCIAVLGFLGGSGYLLCQRSYGPAVLSKVISFSDLPYEGLGADVYAYRAAFSPNGDRVAVVLCELNLKGDYHHEDLQDLIQIRDVATGKVLHALKGHHAMLHSLEFSPDGNRLLSAGRDGTARIWDVSTGKELLSLGILRDRLSAHHRLPWEDNRGFRVDKAYFSGNGQRILALSYWDAGLYVLDAATGKLVRDLSAAMKEKHKHSSEFDVAAISSDGTRIVTSSPGDSLAWLWDVSTGKSLGALALSTHRMFLDHIQFSPNGSQVLGMSIDGSLWIFKLDEFCISHPSSATCPENPPVAGSLTFKTPSFSREKAVFWVPGLPPIVGGSISKSFVDIMDPFDGKTFVQFNRKKVSFDESMERGRVEGDFLQAIYLTPDHTKLFTCTNRGILVWELRGQKRILEKELPYYRTLEKREKEK